MILSKIQQCVRNYPIVRGMITYSITWPVANMIQQSISGKTWKTYDWKETFLFSLYGAFFVAPTLYGWIRLASVMWPSNALPAVLLKTGTEQFSYGPFHIITFIFLMNYMEGKSANQCFAEVKRKFFPTLEIGICVWPVVQTINYSFIPERNRVPFVSLCSLMWTIFLAFVKNSETYPIKQMA